jgi:hypothetical protein
MIPKISKLPDTISGVYELSTELLTLKPVLVPNEPPKETYIKEIIFEHGLGIAIFSNGEEKVLNMLFDKQDYSYSFDYQNRKYFFQIRASLAGISKLVDVNIEYDFKRL